MSIDTGYMIIWWILGYAILLYAIAKTKKEIRCFYVMWSLFAAFAWPFFLFMCALDDVVIWRKKP